MEKRFFTVKWGNLRTMATKMALAKCSRRAMMRKALAIKETHMSDLFGRLGHVIKAEWNSRFSDDPITTSIDTSAPLSDQTDAQFRSVAKRDRPRRTGRMDLGSAWRVLEQRPGSSLEEVRASYAAMSQRYHPRTLSDNPDHAYSAQTVLDGLTEALEILEEELLPLNDPPGGTS